MKTIRDTLPLAAEFLKGKKISRPRLAAEELLAHLLKIKRIDLYLQYDRPLEEVEVDLFRAYIKRRGAGEPWQYIVGEIEFLGCSLQVTPSVLIPRQETEILASQIVAQESGEPQIVWDLCTGSGCIALSLKKAKPAWSVSASDISSSALEVARLNRERNLLELDLVLGDLLEPFVGKKADIVVCNPPYIAEGEYQGLDIEVRAFEPKSALISGATGLEFYEHLARLLPDFLKSGARVYFEIGAGMGARVLSLFSDPSWIEKEVRCDWAGHDRFVILKFRLETD